MMIKKRKKLLRINMNKEINLPLEVEHINRFYSKIKINELTGCYIYLGCKDKDGNGFFRLYRRNIRAHRLAWILENNQEIPEGLCVCHKCDNPICCNPEHLFLATNQDNTKDRDNKGRNAYGERNSGAKLNEKQILEILNIVKTNGNYRGLAVDLAKIYKIHRSQMWTIINRRTWKYLTT